jgi:hypothetical protein
MQLLKFITNDFSCLNSSLIEKKRFQLSNVSNVWIENDQMLLPEMLRPETLVVID